VVGFATVCDLGDIDVLVTDRSLPDQALDMLNMWEVEARVV